MWRIDHFGVIWVCEDQGELAGLSSLGPGWCETRYSRGMIEWTEEYWSDWFVEPAPLAGLDGGERGETFYEWITENLEGDHVVLWHPYAEPGVLFELESDAVLFRIRFA